MRDVAQGLEARRAALGVVRRVLDRRHALSEVLETDDRMRALGDLDRGFALALTRECFRRLGLVDGVLAGWLAKPLPARSGPATHILRLALTEIGYMRTPPYAAGASAVALAAEYDKAQHFKDLINALVRRAGRELETALETVDVLTQAAPAWLVQGWQRHYGRETTEAILDAHFDEPPTDLTVIGDASADWQARLGGSWTPTGSLRLKEAGSIPALAGFADGAWFVQDAAAALPARLFGEVRGLRIYDLCAAPGGKTLQLAAAGASVIALDRSDERAARIRENLTRLRLSAEVEIADARDWRPAQLADGVLLDAPCTATGTIRRHPDLPWIKGPDDIRAFAEQQAELLEAAFALLKPGGRLVYSVCSLEPQESEEIVEAFLAREGAARRDPIRGDEIPGTAGFLTSAGDIRTLPSFWGSLGGIDGFYIARLRRA